MIAVTEIKNTANIEEDQRSLKEIFNRVLYLYMFKPDDYECLDNKYANLFKSCFKNQKVYGKLVSLSEDYDEKTFDRMLANDKIYNERIRK